MIEKYREDTLKEIPSLIRAFGLEGYKSPVLSAVGGGGKTTTLHRLADEYVKAGEKVVVTTTTHIFKESSPWFLEEPSLDEIRKCMDKYGQVWAGMSYHNGRLKGLPEEMLEQILGWNVPVLIEADGARRKPVKVPASHEPVIPGETTHVVSVYGMDCIGRQIGEICFRPELAIKMHFAGVSTLFSNFAHCQIGILNQLPGIFNPHGNQISTKRYPEDIRIQMLKIRNTDTHLFCNFFYVIFLIGSCLKGETQIT